VSSPGGITATTTGTRATVTGLTNNVAYTFTVTAHNAASTSTASLPSAPVTPEGKPPVVTGVVVTELDGTTVQLEWDPVIVGTPATSYTVTSQPGNIVVTSTTPSASVPGLTYGVAYTFTVVASNSYGSAAPSAPSAPVTPGRAPDPVINLQATAGDGEATITWDAPAFDGGSPITSYTVDADSDGITVTVSGDTRSVTVTGLTNGIAYAFLVIPSNAFGSTLSSYTNAVVPVGPPPVVSGLVVTVVGDGMVRLEWDPSTVDAPATSFTVASLPDGNTYTTTDAFLDIYGLTDGVQYSFTVVANSPLGNAAPSAPVFATPVATP
jgi:Fibronectin type III domain